jgi:hypothetical protein
MHLQGGKRSGPVAQEGTVFHEGNEVHYAEVVESDSHSATLEYLNDGRKITVTKGEFSEIFEP